MNSLHTMIGIITVWELTIYWELLLNASHMVPHLFLRPTLYCTFYCSHYTYKGTEAWGQTFPRGHSHEDVHLDLPGLQSQHCLLRKPMAQGSGACPFCRWRKLRHQIPGTRTTCSRAGNKAQDFQFPSSTAAQNHVTMHCPEESSTYNYNTFESMLFPTDTLFLDIKWPWYAYTQNTVWHGLCAYQTMSYMSSPVVPAGRTEGGFREESTLTLREVGSFVTVAVKMIVLRISKAFLAVWIINQGWLCWTFL